MMHLFNIPDLCTSTCSLSFDSSCMKLWLLGSDSHIPFGSIPYMFFGWDNWMLQQVHSQILMMPGHNQVSSFLIWITRFLHQMYFLCMLVFVTDTTKWSYEDGKYIWFPLMGQVNIYEQDCAFSRQAPLSQFQETLHFFLISI
jgi:hypothetical protein